MGLTILGLDPSASSFFAAVTANGGTISPGRQTLYNNLFASLRSQGYLALLNRLGIMAAENAATAAVDLVDPTKKITPMVLIPFTANQGYTGNGSSQFIETNQDPTASSLMSQNSSSFGAGTLSTRSAGADMVLIGNVQISGAYGIFPNSTAPSVISDNSDTPFASTFTLPNPTVKGIWQNSRSAAATRVTTLNGIQGQSSAQASAAPTTGKTFWLGGWRNTDGATLVFPSTDNLCLWFCGAPFTVPQSLGFANILNTYMTAIGSPLF